jgi:pilus assembly protein TadC
MRAGIGAAGTGAVVALLVGGAIGAALGFVVAGASGWLLHWRAGRTDALGPSRRAELPIAADLLAVCLLAGLPVGAALGAVAEAVTGSLAAELRCVANLHRLGAEPRRAWADVAPELTGLARVLVRAGESGSNVVPALRALAADIRAELRADAEARVRRAGVWVLAPLGLCFLPAFLCLGVVPLVLGIARGAFP